MSGAVDYYISAFSPQSLYGFYHIVAIFSLVVLVWMFGLSYLVSRQTPIHLKIDLLSLIHI